MDGLDWHVTGLWYPGADSVPYYGRIADPGDGDVGILLNDSRSAEVTVSVWEPVVAAVFRHTYARFLKVYYHDQLVFWGPCKLTEGDMAAGTVKLAAVDPGLRLLHHQLRRGDLDGAMSRANDDRANLTIDYVGLRLLRDAGLNTAGQTARGVPDLGIVDGSNTDSIDLASLMGVARGDEVWSTMTGLTAHAGAPDFELEPSEETDGAYANLNTYDHQGDDISALVAWHFGTGKQNLENLTWVEGEKYTTHDHVLSRDLKRRVTVANAEASAETGPYVDWDATDYDTAGVASGPADDVLHAYGEAVLAAYSRPLLTVQLALPIESDSDYRYGVDYKIGDTAGVAGRAGLIELEEADYRITAVRLKQAGAESAVRPEIEVIPDRVAAAGDSVDTQDED